MCYVYIMHLYLATLVGDIRSHQMLVKKDMIILLFTIREIQ